MEGEHEKQLVAQAAAGRTEAFRKLFEAHHAAMFRFAYRLTGAVDAAEDIAQECFLRLVGCPTFDHERGSLRQYLYGIVRNLARQRRQAKGREGYWDDNIEDGSKLAAARVNPLASTETAAVMQAALSALPRFQREAIALCEFEELSLNEAAAILGCDVGTVKSRLYRAREGLRRLLTPYRSQARRRLPKGTTL